MTFSSCFNAEAEVAGAEVCNKSTPLFAHAQGPTAEEGKIGVSWNMQQGLILELSLDY